MIPKEALFFSEKITHIGREWSIVTEENEGASWDWDKATITIGIKGQPGEIFERVYHEILEMTLMSLFLRFYSNHGDENYLFVFDHRAFTSALEITMPVALQFLRFEKKEEETLTEEVCEEACGVPDH